MYRYRAHDYNGLNFKRKFILFRDMSLNAYSRITLTAMYPIEKLRGLAILNR